jgi:hypothetical protein
MKKFLLFTSVILLIAGGAFVFLSGDVINALIKEQIETVGTQVTEQAVTVDKVDMKLLKGAGTINGLVIANPSQYNAPSVFSLDEITLDINLKSLTTDLIVIDQIIIDKPQAVVEFTESGGANIKDILDAIKKNSASGAAKPKQETTANADPIIRVNKFVLAGVALTVDLTKLGNKAHQATLADINLTNIGGEAGMPASELGAELVKQALSSIWKQAKSQQTEIFKGQVEDKVKDKVKEKLGGFLDKLNG